MKKETNIGVQLYMIRDHIGNKAQIRNALHKIKRIGFGGVELCGFLMDEQEEWKSHVREAGLEVTSLHEIAEDMFAGPDQFIKKAKSFGCRNLVAAASVKTDFSDIKSVKKLAENLNALGSVFAGEGIELLYHNHNAEFTKLDKNCTAMDVLIEETDKRLVAFEFDSFWTAAIGANPIDWIRMLKDRIPFYHINDCGVAPGEPGDLMRSIVGTELGSGILNLYGLVRAAKDMGCETIILETHDNWINNDPFDSMEASYGCLSNLI